MKRTKKNKIKNEIEQKKGKIAKKKKHRKKDKIKIKNGKYMNINKY